MDIYVARADSLKRTLKQRAIHRAIAVLCFSGIYFILMFGWKFFWPTLTERNRGLFSIAVETGLVSVFWGLAMVFLPRKLPSYKLLVDDGSISGVTEYTGWMKWWVVRRTISKGKVRTMWEIKGRLGLPSGMAFSERRSRFGARMWGFVFLSTTLPDYESLRTLAESWRSREETN
jgi:hypothetical protein